MSSDRNITLEYPLPIAKLYQAMQFKKDPGIRIDRLVNLFERTSQYLVLVGLACYRNQCLSEPRVEKLRPDLVRPSLGHWVGLLKEINRCLRPHDLHYLTADPRHNYKNEPIGAAVEVITDIVGLDRLKKVQLHHFLDRMVEFRNKKIGHGDLSSAEAKKIKNPLEEAIIQWLSEIPTLHERHLIYVSDVKWQNQRFVYEGVKLNSGVILEPLDLNGDKPIDEDRVYLHLPANDMLIPLSPFFAYQPDPQILYYYSQLSDQGLVLRCPYDSPGADPELISSRDNTIVVGDSPISEAASPVHEAIEESEAVVVSPKPSPDSYSETEDVSPEESVNTGQIDEPVSAAYMSNVVVEDQAPFEEELIKRRIDSLQKTWDSFQERIEELHQERADETRSSEMRRLKNEINAVEKEQTEIGNKLSKLKTDLKKIEDEKLTSIVLQNDDAQKSKHQNAVNKTRRAMFDLADFMKEPEVRDEVVVFHTKFESVSSQIHNLVIYKDMHDHLQKLENKCNSVVHNIKDFPNDTQVLVILEDFYTLSQQTNNEILELAAQVSLDSVWIIMLNEAQENLIKAIESANQRQLEDVIHDIKRVLDRLPSDINDQLKSVKLHFHLSDLTETIMNLQNKMTQFDLDAKKFSRFTADVEEMNSLSQALNSLVENHDQWQETDNRLSALAVDLEDISIIWPYYKSRLTALYNNNTESWATLLRTTAAQLDAAIIEKNAKDIEVYLQILHNRVTAHFNWVDVQLKNLCEDLVKIGDSLDAVLDMMT